MRSLQCTNIDLFTPVEKICIYAGTGLATFALEGVQFGLAVCYDLRSQSSSAGPAQRRNAVIVPAAWPESRLRVWELFIQSRAAENQMYIVGVNTTGTNPVDQYAGASMTADPHGNIIARAGKGNELLYMRLIPLLRNVPARTFP